MSIEFALFSIPRVHTLSQVSSLVSLMMSPDSWRLLILMGCGIRMYSLTPTETRDG